MGVFARQAHSASRNVVIIASYNSYVYKVTGFNSLGKVRIGEEGMMLGRVYRSIPRCRWHCCPAYGLNKAKHRSANKRARAREKRAWKKEQW